MKITGLGPKFPLFVCLALTLGLSPLAHAQSLATAPAPAAAPVFPAPASTEAATAPEYQVDPTKETHPMIRLSPDKPQIVHLDAPARSVLVGNPAHLNVVMDNTTTLVLVPRDPGATHFTVIGRDGKIVMQRYVIVAGPADKYIRIRRSCANAGANANCAKTSVYYCPDMCYETEIMGSADNSGAGTSTAAPAAAGAPPASTISTINPVNASNPASAATVSGETK